MRCARYAVIDCGANIGMSVLFFKAFKPDAEVLAFEPDPMTFAGLLQNADRNGLRNVRAENAAVGDRDGTIALYRSSTDPGGLTGSIDPSWGGQQRQDVRVVRRSALLRQPVDFLKLDVEGAEYEIVADLISTGAIQWVLETMMSTTSFPHR
jgi:FkbM family methyltransferase